MNLDLSLECAQEHAAHLSQEDFMKKYFLPQKPVLLKGLAKLQPAGNKWTIDWFKKTMGNLDIAVFDNNEKRHVYSTTVTPDIKMPFHKFLDIISSDQTSSIRMFRYNLYKQNPDLRKDFSCPSFFNRNIMKRFGFMFIGGKNTAVRLHFDVDRSNVLLTQITGSKSVVLFEPKYTPYLYRVPFNTHSLMDIKNSNEADFPGIRYVKGMEVIQEAGDGLFMPSGYWHYNTYLEGGISVAFRKLAHTPGSLLKGIIFIVLTMPVDMILTRILGNKWQMYKDILCKERVKRAIAPRPK
ncbi:MAG: cupin-like domain-containing protein [Cyclobacteriaceae bacterium]|nr:cupin-like domain-containing protein [Cyclobacteriaceae bacterium]MDH4297980.1 cupin-like domain-containing protein [Cyclobacteriaceae bacterium]MDH5251215.1 cupin-like domain-containing protein [Cyclobacteriaceae bacterium]